VPDSLLVGLGLIAISLASRPHNTRWYHVVVISLCVAITLTKEVGLGIVALVALVLIVRRSYRLAVVAGLTCALIFALVVLPTSTRPGRVIWDQPLDTEITMERFRVIIAGAMWPDLSPGLAQVEQAAAGCGMTYQQLIAETFRLTDRFVDYASCPELWRSVDAVSQFDILEAHFRNPVHVGGSLERGFFPDMYAMSLWGDYPVDSPGLMTLDRFHAAAAALVPLMAVVVAVLRRRGRALALVAVLGSAMAMLAALVDPSSQDRHTLVFRIAAFAIALLALTEATGTRCSVVEEGTSVPEVGEGPETTKVIDVPARDRAREHSLAEPDMVLK